MNGTTWLDRTNYFETMPAHQLELALWLEADRMGTLLDALSQENLDNQREVVKNEKRWSLRQPAVRLVEREAPGATCSRRTTPTTTRRSARWRTSTRRRSRTSATFFRTYYAPNNAVLSRRRRRRPGAGRAPGPSATSGRIPPTRPSRRCRDLSLPPIARRGAPRDRARQRPAAARLLRVPRAGLRRPAARRARARRPDPRRRQGQPAPSPARPRGADRAGRRAVHARVHRRRVDHRRLGDGPARASTSTRVEAAYEEELERLAPRARRATTSWPARRRSSRPTSWARSSGSRSGPTASRCTRRCSTTRA